MRKFRIDASKKIQASPIDFDSIADYRGSGPSAIKQELDKHKSELISYMDAKFKQLEQQVNSDLDRLVQKYVTDIELFSECLSDPAIGKYSTLLEEPSNIISGMEYSADTDPSGRVTWLYLTADDTHYNSEYYEDFYAEMELSHFGAYHYLIDSYRDDIRIYSPDAEGMFNWLYLLFTKQPDFYKQVSPDTIISVIEQLIYGYCEFFDEFCSHKAELAIKVYFEKADE